MNKFNNILQTSDELSISGKKFRFNNILKLEKNGLKGLSSLPFTYKILIENLIRNSNNVDESFSDVEKIIQRKVGGEIQFKPSRVLMQDYTGVPAVADLASMRDYLKKKKINPKIINPSVPVSLVVDHSIIVDSFGKNSSLALNVENEFLRNQERYELLKWAQKTFKNFRVFPPGSGICHQINIEYISEVVSKQHNEIFFDTVVGTDSHTTMVNALAILGWGVGGIEAESVMLGQSISMQIPEVVGVNLIGKLKAGVTATDLVLYITEKLRKLGVVGKFVEFHGNGLDSLSLSERSTISNMAPEYGATCGFFPVDLETLKYLKITGRSTSQINLVEKYSKVQGTWYNPKNNKVNYDINIDIKIDDVESSLAGPKRPQDRISLRNLNKSFIKTLSNKEKLTLKDNSDNLNNGSVCLAAITSCTNTSNPSVLITAGLIAKKAVSLGIKIPLWVKTSFAPGSQVVEEYLKQSYLLKPLEKLGFNIVGFGCTTCIGNSGPLDENIEKKIKENNLNVCSVISGNRNFEGRIHPLIKSNYLASPPIVVLYAIAGKINFDLRKDRVDLTKKQSISLLDLWPNELEVKQIINRVVKKSLFKKKYRKIYEGDKNWKNIKTQNSSTYKWSTNSTYIKKPPFLELKKEDLKSVSNARPLLILGDSVTTDHISPAGVIKEGSAAGNYLKERQISKNNFNSFGARRGNHEIMVRGTFANVRIKNQMVKKEGGYSIFYPEKIEDEVFYTSERYKKESTSLLVIAGKEYGTGSSRDWAAKGTKLLGVKVVLAESFERIHRSNLVGMGILPLELKDDNLNDLNLSGKETFNFGNLESYYSHPNKQGKVEINYKNTHKKTVNVLSRIDTLLEIKYMKSNGILPYVLEEIC